MKININSIVIGKALFSVKKLSNNSAVDAFSSSISEYTDYLQGEAFRAQKDHVALTWLLCEKSTNAIAAYMSLIADAIKISASEKELHHLDYPFKTIPAMKIAKLSVDSSFREKYRGIGSFMINIAIGFAQNCNDEYLSCRFLTVDADVENDRGIAAFYQKNGFMDNRELNNSRRKTLSMRKDIYS